MHAAEGCGFDPSQGTYIGEAYNPWSGRPCDAHSRRFSLTSTLPPLPSLSLNAMKKKPLGQDKKEKKNRFI